MASMRLAWRLLRRDWFSGELKVLIMALLVAVTGVSAINFFTDRIRIAMDSEAAQFIGADLQLSGSRESQQQWLDKAQQAGLTQAKSLVFASVVAANDNFQLASVRAVDTLYPLLGSLRLRTQFDDAGVDTQAPPEPGTVWVDSRLYQKLGLSQGDSIEVGSASFKLAGIIQDEPGRGGSLLNFVPRLVLNMQDVPMTEVLQPGSRVTWQYQFAGQSKVITKFESWLRAEVDSTWRIVGGKDGIPSLEQTLKRAQSFLGLAGLASLLLAGIAIAMVANRYAEHHFDHGALLRCFGASRALVLKIYSFNLLVLGLITSFVGSLCGYLVHNGLLALMQPLLPDNLPEPGVQSFLVAIAIGIITLAGFALPALVRLGQVSPLRVLRRNLTPTKLNGYLIYLLTIFTMGLLMWWQTDNLKMVLIVLVGGSVAAIVLSLIAKAILKSGLVIKSKLKGSLRFGVSQLARHEKASVIQILAFGLALLVMMLIFLLRNELIDNWRLKLATDTPNHFLVNVEGTDVNAVEQYFDERQIKTAGLYPMIRSRVELPETATGQVRREVNITYSTQLPEHNELIAGTWAPETTASGLPPMSVEQRFMERRNLSIGDVLKFDTGGRTYAGEITSVREVKWDSFKPNFFIMFTTEAISDLSATWMTSFYLASDKKQQLNALVKQFPSTSLIELDAIMMQVQRVIEQVSIAVEYILVFVLIAGIMVLLASVQASMDDRLFESTILRTFGASKSYIRNALLTEFCFLGFLAGLLAVIGVELVAYGLYQELFNLNYQLHPWLWLIGPVAGILIIGLSGNLASSKVVKQPPMISLRAS
jgi:putative ABC transport system permease protein